MINGNNFYPVDFSKGGGGGKEGDFFSYGSVRHLSVYLCVSPFVARRWKFMDTQQPGNCAEH